MQISRSRIPINIDRSLNEIEAQNSDVDFFDMELCNGRAVSTSYGHAAVVGPPNVLFGEIIWRIDERKGIEAE